MPLVLAIEPDSRQAAVLKRVIRNNVKAEFALVDSRDAARAAITARIPDVILVTALMSPRDEDELVAFLRSLEGAEHLQTHTIPQLSLSAEDIEPKSSGGLFGVFRRKKDEQLIIAACDPDLFAEEVRQFLARAAERKQEYAATREHRAAKWALQSAARAEAENIAAASPAATPDEPAPPAPDSAWSSPFEWRRTDRTSRPAEKPSPPAEPQSAPTEPILSLVTKVPLAVEALAQEEQAAKEAELQRLAAEAAERKRAEE